MRSINTYTLNMKIKRIQFIARQNVVTIMIVCIYTWARHGFRWHNETTNHKSPTEKNKDVCFFFLCVVVFFIFYIFLSFFHFVVVVSRPLFYPSLVCLFVCSIIGCVTICSLSLCMTEQKKTEIKQCLTTNKTTSVRCWCCCCFFFVWSLNGFFPCRRFYRQALLCSHATHLYVLHVKEICHMFVLGCDWFDRYNQWQNSISFIVALLL